MESLYRKYRPQTFADVVGQQHVVGTLEHAVLEGRTSHAYLFCGPRGTGKTTMARLLAKALMCEHGPGRLPDGTCEQCQLIAAGEHPDVYELDAASRTGVDNVREEIINRVSYAPVQGRYKVYIIDEVHMLTTAAFNALLKTLEEPPDHVVFVLCTTDPQKIPATILSRVQRFDFRPIGNEDIQHHLEFVCQQEGFTYEDAAIELVVRNARGGMRDALSTLEQLSVFGGGIISLDAAQDMLGAVTGAALEHVVDAMAARDIASLFAQVASLVDSGRDLLQFTRELAARLRDIYVVIAVGANPAVLPGAADVARLQLEAAAFGSTDRLARILTVLGDVSKEMGTTPNQRLALEIAFTRIARPEADLTLDSLAERVAMLEQQLAAVTAGGGSASRENNVEASQLAAAPQFASVPQSPSSEQVVPVAPPAPPHMASRQADSPQPTPRPVGGTAPSQPVAPVPSQPVAPVPSQVPMPRPQEVPASQPVPAGATDRGALQRLWRNVVADLVARVPARGSLLSNAVALSDDGSTLLVGLPKGSTFALKMLERPDVRAVVDAVVNEIFGVRKLVFTEGIGGEVQAQGRPANTPGQNAMQGSSQPVVAAAPQGGCVSPAAPAAPSAGAPVQEKPPAQPPAQDYPMPWDDPGQPAPVDEAPITSYESVPYEPVPYDEMYGADVAVAEIPSTKPSSQSESASDVQAAPLPHAEAQTPEPVTTKARGESAPSEPDPARGVGQQPQQPEPQPQQPDPQPTSAQVVPDDLPADLSAILENAFEVFGSDVQVRKG